MMNNACPECGVHEGQYHRHGCDIEICPYCGEGLMSCACPAQFPPLDDRIPWSGTFPGEDECREFGWFAHLLPRRGWVACSEDDPGAEPDLHRLRQDAVWDRSSKRFVLPEMSPK